MFEEAIIQVKDDLDEDLSVVTAGDHGEMILRITCRLRLALTPQKFSNLPVRSLILENQSHQFPQD